MILSHSETLSDPITLFMIGGLSDIDLASNQSLKNTIKYLSALGYRIHVFSAFPEEYPILQNPKVIFNEGVAFHRLPKFFTPLFDFVKFLKDILGMRRKASGSPEKLKPAQKIKYFDEYNLTGRLFYIIFCFFYIPVEMIRVSFYCFKFNPQLFYGINGQGCALVSLLGLLYRKPAIQRWHGSFYTEEDVKKIQTRWTHKLLTLDGGFAKWLPSNAVIVTNDGTQGEKIFRLFGIAPEKIYFWMNGMDLDDMTLPMDWNPQEFKKNLGLEGKKVLMMASRLVLWKRVDRGIGCLSRLVHEHGMEDAILLILGQGPEYGNLLSLVQEMKVQNHVRFVGAVPHSEIARYYSIADVFLNLYDVSNLGNPLLEAMYCALPIASIDDGSTAEILQDGYNAFLVPHERLETELPKKVLSLLIAPCPRLEFIKNVKKTFDEKILSWKDRMLLEHELIQKLLGFAADIPAFSKKDSIHGARA